MDFQIVTFINQFWHGTPLLWTGQTRLDILSKYISRDGSLLIIRALVIALAVFLKRKYRRFVLLSFILAWGLFYLVSEIGFKTLLIQETGIRPRPYITHETTIKPIGTNYTDSSFPSSHMVITLAMITVLIILFPSVWPYAILYALIMAWSRMFNGMHYPSDILVWSMIGIWCGWLAVASSKRVFPSK